MHVVKWRPSLRTKGTLAGVLAALVVSVAASSLTYFVGRSYLITQRESTAVTQALAAARTAANGIQTGQSGVDAVVRATRTLPLSLALFTVEGESFASGVGISRADLPSGFLDSLTFDRVSIQRVNWRGEPRIIVGVLFQSDFDASFVVVLPMVELRDTLGVLRNALSLGVLVAAAGGGALGRRLSRRVMEPLHAIGVAATDITAGDLTRRVAEPREPDLAAIARAFNEMTSGLSDRITRESQFSAMVSHELRTPLTVIRGAAEMIDDDAVALDERSRVGLGLLRERINGFERILNDLIEISRYGSDTVTPNLEVRSAPRLIAALLARFEMNDDLLECVDTSDGAAGDGLDVVIDVKRFVQTFENLKRNADLYGGGLVAIRIEPQGDSLCIHFDDAGPGVPVEYRDVIFDSFVRAQHHSATPGSGLGLAIARQHCRAMGGELTVGDSPEGGARFTVRLARSSE